MNVLLMPTAGIAGASLATFGSIGLLFGLLTIRSRRIVRLARPPSPLIAKIVLAAKASSLFSQLPTSSAMTAVRALVAIGCLVAFVAMLASVLAPTRFALARQVSTLFHSPAPAAAA